MPSIVHPTKTKLVETTVKLLQQFPRQDISADMILTASRISKGSLYHHFADLDELIEAALLEKYAAWVDGSIDKIMEILATSNTSEDVYQKLIEITKLTQNPARKSERLFRAEVLGIASHSPRFAAKLAIEQQRLTDALYDIIRETQEAGYFTKDIDARAIAVLIQAYTLGKVIDDFSQSPVDPESWNDLINVVIRKVFINLQ